MDYVAAMTNNLGMILAIEKLLDLEIPPRAQALRVICCELQRIAAHLIAIGTTALDLAGTIHALLMYCFREREEVLNIFEMISGARITPTYFRVGGVRWDVPPHFAGPRAGLLQQFPRHLDEYETMVMENPIWLSRTVGVGVISRGGRHRARADRAVPAIRRHRARRPPLRAVFGLRAVRVRDSNYDQRRLLRPLRHSYPTRCGRRCGSSCRRSIDCRMARSSWTIARSSRLRARSWIRAWRHWSTSSSCITEGFSPPPGEVYGCVEAPKGEIGYYVVSDGSPRPYRLKIRGPSFSNLSALNIMSRDAMFSDMVAIIGGIDITLGEVDR